MATTRMSWDEICASYADMWVVLGDADAMFETAFVVAAHRDRREAEAMEVLRRGEVTVFYTGMAEIAVERSAA